MENYDVNTAYTSTMNPKGFRDLFLSPIGDSNYLVRYLELHPSQDYLARKGFNTSNLDMRSFVDNHDYEGYFLVFDENNQLIYGENRKNGRPVTKLTTNQL